MYGTFPSVAGVWVFRRRPATAVGARAAGTRWSAPARHRHILTEKRRRRHDWLCPARRSRAAASLQANFAVVRRQISPDLHPVDAIATEGLLLAKPTGPLPSLEFLRAETQLSKPRPYKVTDARFHSLGAWTCTARYSAERRGEDKVPSCSNGHASVGDRVRRRRRDPRILKNPVAEGGASLA